MIYIGLKALNIFNILVQEVAINVLKKTSLIESSVEDKINQTYIEKLSKIRFRIHKQCFTKI